MGTTPNYSWPYPESSDYVADGATAIENLADAVDTTVGDIDDKMGLILVGFYQLPGQVSSLTLTNVFSADYDSYLVIFNCDSANASHRNVYMQMGSTISGYLSSYTFAFFSGSMASDGSISPGTLLNTGFFLGTVRQSRGANFHATVHRPYRNTRTAGHCSYIYQYPNQYGGTGNTGYMLENTTSYTDLTILPDAGTVGAGSVRVYGYRYS